MGRKPLVNRGFCCCKAAHKCAQGAVRCVERRRSTSTSASAVTSSPHTLSAKCWRAAFFLVGSWETSFLTFGGRIPRMGIAGFADVEQEDNPCVSPFLPRFPSQDGPRECRWQRALTWRETLARPGPATAQEVPCPSRATELSRSQRTSASLSRKFRYTSEILLSAGQRKNITRKMRCAGNKSEGLLAGPGPRRVVRFLVTALLRAGHSWLGAVSFQVRCGPFSSNLVCSFIGPVDAFLVPVWRH